ncbi:MAG: vWA domain-containing protein [Eubacteriales bacterium]|nr:vWA domain-containing protein [Eubacteriales bacterium]
MNNKRPFLILAWILSAGSATAACIAMDPGRWIPEQTVLQRIIWSGLFFAILFLAGFTGLSLGLKLHRRYRIHRSRSWLPVCVLCALLLFGVGAGGQALFTRSRSEEIYHPSPADVVLLLDDSSSMEQHGYDVPRTEAACRFIDSLDENTRLQIIAFSGTIREYAPLTPADDAGRELLKTAVRSIDLTGTTNFDLPLEEAVKSLLENGLADSGKAIILFTDGEASISDEIFTKVKDSGSLFFSVRITETGEQASTGTSAAGASGIVTDTVSRLIRLTEETGGSDIALNPGTDGSIFTDDLLNAFQTAFAATTEMIRTVPDGLLVLTAEITPYQRAVRVITILLCAVLIGTGYFGGTRPLQILLNLVCGSLFAVSISPASGRYMIVAVSAGLLLGSAIVLLRLSDGNSADAAER